MWRVVVVFLLSYVVLQAQILLDDAEKAWLRENHTVRVHVGNWAPFMIENAKSHSGISIEYLTKIFQKHDISYRFISPQEHTRHQALAAIADKSGVDLLPAIKKTPEHRQKMLFTDNYIRPPWVIFTRDDAPFIVSIDNLADKKVSVQESEMISQRLSKEYPKIRVHAIGGIDQTQKALYALAMGEVEAYIGDLVTGTYLARQLHLSNIKVAAPTPFGNHDNAMAIRDDWPALVSLINKELLALSASEKEKIWHQYLPMRYEHGIQPKDVFIWIGIVVIACGVIIILIYASNIKRDREIRKRKAVQRELSQYMELMDKYVITSSTDKEGVITHVSEAFCAISKYSQEELLGQRHGILRHPDMPDSLYKGMWGTITKGRVWTGEIKNLAKDGSIYWVKAYISPQFDTAGKIIGYISIRQDITSRKKVEELSITDSLTGLYNRRHFDAILPTEINRAKRKNRMVTFMMLDIDHFKQYNDTYGHQKGDDVLKKVAKVLLENLQRADDYAFRVGGEEFGILVIGLDEGASLILAQKIQHDIEALHITHDTSPTKPYITVSFGLTCKHANSIENKDILYKLSDDLLYSAKDAGRNCIKTNF